MKRICLLPWLFGILLGPGLLRPAAAQYLPFDHWAVPYLSDMYLWGDARISPFVFPPDPADARLLITSAKNAFSGIVPLLATEFDRYRARQDSPFIRVWSGAETYGGDRLFSSEERNATAIKLRGFGRLSSRLSMFARMRVTNRGEGIVAYSGTALRERLSFNSAEWDYAFFRFSGGNGYLDLGRFKQTWGAFRNESLLLSDLSASYDGFNARLKFKSLSLRFFGGYLETVLDSTKTADVQRYIAGHLLEFRYKHLALMAGETIVYSGTNRPIDFSYLIPLIPFIESDANSRFNKRTPEQDNAFLLFALDYHRPHSWRGYARLLIDDYQIDAKDRARIPDNTAYQVGVQFPFSVLRAPQYVSAEYTRVGTWTYRYTRPAANYQSRGLLLGFSEGSDLERWTLAHVMYLPLVNRSRLRFSIIRSGQRNILEERFGLKNKFLRVSFPSGVVQKEYAISWEGRIQPSAYIYGDVLLGYQIFRNYRHVARQAKNQFLFGIHVEIVVPFSLY